MLNDIIFHKRILVTLDITRVSYNKNTINIQIIVQKCVVKPLNVTVNFLY